MDHLKSLAVAGSALAGLYLVNLIAPSLGPVEWLQKVSPFHYYNPLTIPLNCSVNWAGIAIYLLAALGFSVAALIVFEKRDLTY